MRIRPEWLAALVAVAAVAAYLGCLHGPFLFDDLPSIVGNPSIRHWGLGALHPPHGDGWTVEGRPVLNLTFAINYAIGEYDPFGYHLGNILLHAANALLLFGLLRRSRISENAAFVSALLWAVHPLATESVAYISQRAESLAACFYLLTLYCFARATAADAQRTRDTSPPPESSFPDSNLTARAAAQNPSTWGWLGAAVLACGLGMGSKEIVVSAPVAVLLYDRAFVSGSIREAWRRRWRFYLALGATWILLAALVLGTGNRGGTVGGGGRWAYAAAQLHGLVHYVRLAFWPSPLVFDYGTYDHQTLLARAACGAAVAALVIAVLLGLDRNKRWAWAAAVALMILLPASSLIPIRRQIFAEHRMYLPLAALIALVVIPSYRRWPRIALSLAALAAVALGSATVARCRVYLSDAALYEDSAASQPGNASAQANWGVILLKQGRTAEGDALLKTALQLDPDNADTRYNLGTALEEQGRLREAAEQLAAAVRLDPDHLKARQNLGRANRLLAVEDYNQAYRLSSGHRPADAIPLLQEAIAHDPSFAEAHLNLANALAATGHPREAIAEYRTALRLSPDLASAKIGLSLAQKLLSTP